MAQEPIDQPGIAGEELEEENLNPAMRNYERSRRELGQKFDEARKIAGTINKLKMVIPVTEAAIQFVLASITLIGPIAVGLLFITVVLLAVGGFLLWYNQPNNNFFLRNFGSHRFPEPVNVANSVDRENLLRVQSAAGLIPTLQRELIESRELDTRINSAIQALRSANIPQDKRNDAINLLKEMETLAKKVRETTDPGNQNNLLQELHTLGLRFEFLTTELFLPGGSRRLKVPWRLQPVKSTTCNYYAAMMAVLYHAYDRSAGPPEKKSYSRELEEKIMAGRTDPPKSCPANTEAYLRFAAGQAGLTNAKVETIHFSGSRSGKRGPSDQDWQKIKDIVERTKTPVVIGTRFSKRNSHFLTIVGFSEDGREVYVNDPGSMHARSNIKIPKAYRERNSPVHLIDDERWYGGTHPKASYLTFQ